MRKKRLRELEAGEGESLPGSDEDTEREVWLTQIHLCTLKAADTLWAVKQVRTLFIAFGAFCLLQLPSGENFFVLRLVRLW